MGVASGAATLFRTLGGSLGVSLLGAIYSNRLTGDLTERLGAKGTSVAANGTQLTPMMLRRLPEDIRAAFMHAVASGVQGVFLWATAFTAVAFVVAWFIREVPLRGAPLEEGPGAPVTGGSAPTGVVTEPIGA
jgi:hypothetical protein